MKFIFFAGAFFCAVFLSAQTTNFVRKDSVPVFYNNQQLSCAWTGGINYAQFSDIDLNLDGINDLFIFDRSGNKITTFINLGTPNQVAYIPAMQYIPRFPRMHDWVLLRDYNCDGKMDIFTSNESMVEVFENISTLANGLQFQLVTQSILANLAPNSTDTIGPVNVSWIDIPAIRDVDGDGDLDILNFGLNGFQVEFYRNLSEENYGTCDSLNFRLESLCWGEFTESQLDATITLSTPCNAPPIHPQDNSHNAFLHAGSCLECLNIDGDNDADLLVGDLTNPYINFIRNGGTNSYAIADTVDTFFPGYDTAMAVRVFGCGFHLDVDNDGVRDLVFSSNALYTSDNYKSSWYYHNTTNDNAMHAHFVEKDFMQNKMIEVGEGAYPVFFDYDSDGDDDLFIGNRGYFDPSGVPNCMIALYKNTGTAASPVFTLKTLDFAGIFSQGLGIIGLAPAFGDMDGDGDADMIVGDGAGRLDYFRKDPGNDTNFVFVQSYYQSIDVGAFATPQIVDVDRDGKLDLLIGEQTGNVNFYRNTGTATSASFSLSSTFFGNFVVSQSGFTTGYSTPMLYDDNGNYVLFVGSERGYLFRFDNIDGNLSGNFTRTDSMYVSSYEGERIAPAITDLNNDGYFDVAIGNLAGGVSLFYGDNTISIEELSPSVTFNLFPNPASSNITIETAEAPFSKQSFKIFDLSGKEIMSEEISQQRTNISTEKLSAGIYICSMSDAKGFSVNKKLIISR